jgi:hypothetical protein
LAVHQAKPARLDISEIEARTTLPEALPEIVERRILEIEDWLGVGDREGGKSKSVEESRIGV